MRALWALAPLLLLSSVAAAGAVLSGSNTTGAATSPVAAGASGRARRRTDRLANLRRLHGAGADQTSCSFEPTYCGGGDCPDGRPKADPGCQISCSPFPVQDSTFLSNPPDWCRAPYPEEVTRFTGRDGQALAWFDVEWDAQDPQDPNKNYWVFHGCDGSGLMTGDCAGTGWTVEQYFALSDQQVPMPRPSCKAEDDPWCWHTAAPYMHPGTKRLYERLNVGMWTNGEGMWADQQGVDGVGEKAWWKNMGLPDVQTLSPVPGKTAFAVMYPWVCGYTPDEEWSWFWGGDLQPYGADTLNVKCYYDNEPWSGDHFTSTLIPPVWQAYKWYKNDDTDEVWGWMLAEKVAEDPNPRIYYNNLGDEPQFKLKWMASPPW